MWNSLYGKITYRGLDRIHLLVGGIEWSLYVSGNTLAYYASSKEEVRILTYLKGSSLGVDVSLFGFYDEKERDTFLKLIEVSSVGSKASLQILSTFTPDRLQDILEKEDLNSLVAVKGVGKKTAQKIFLALKGKIIWSEESVGDLWVKEIEESLVSMGFESKRVQTIIKEILKDNTFEDSLSSGEKEKLLFSQALSFLTRA